MLAAVDGYRSDEPGKLLHLFTYMQQLEAWGLWHSCYGISWNEL